MRKYQSDATSYNAIVEAMQQIRQNALAESYSEDEMEEAYMYEEDDEEDMAEMSGEEEEAVAEMMDEALYEMDMDDDEDNLNEADDGSRKARRRKRMRQALLIGAGLAAAGGLGAAYTAGRGARAGVDPGLRANMPGGLGGIVTDIQTGVGMGRRSAGRAVSGGIDAAGKRVNYAKEYNRLVRGKQGLA